MEQDDKIKSIDDEELEQISGGKVEIFQNDVFFGSGGNGGNGGIGGNGVVGGNGGNGGIGGSGVVGGNGGVGGVS